MLVFDQAQQLVFGGDQVAVFVEIADDQLGGAVHVFFHVQRAQLPHQMVGQSRGLGEEVLERRLLAVFHLDGGAQAGIEVFGEERAEIDFFEGVFFFGGFGRLFQDRG